MLTERKAIEEAIHWNRDEITRMREESRVLFEQNTLYTKRLRELDELDRTNGQIIAMDPNETIQLLVQQNQLVADFIAAYAPKPNLMEDLEPILAEEEETTVTTKRIVTETEESTVTIKKKRNDFKKQASTVASILKSSGRPTSLEDIQLKLSEDHAITWDFPTNSMDLIMRHEPRISRAARGMYQVKQ
jgi:hypothetical protein